LESGSALEARVHLLWEAGNVAQLADRLWTLVDDMTATANSQAAPIAEDGVTAE